MKALALTDSGNLYGAIEFYKECREQEIKPIIGVDFYVARRTRKDKEARVDNERDRLILLAENNAGYLNLLKLVTDSYLEGFYYKPRIDRELLEKYNDGLIAISTPARHGFAAGESGGESKWYREIFGERFYLGVTPQSLPNLKKKDENIVAIYDVHYLEPADRPVLDTLVSIQGQLRENHTFNKEVDRSFISADQAKEDFRNFPEAIENTVKIADRCNVELELGKWVFPNYVVESGKSYNEELRIIVYSGLEKKKLNKTSEIIERIEYELKIITDKGYAPYFLVAADLLRYAHNHGILTNTRGSAAGSMVTYLSGITTIDPIKYALPFERFLNPDRPSPPDIDLDIADDRRDELIEYARHKYGADHVAQIGTFGTMMARGAVRDVTRALGFSYTLGDQIAKLIPMGAQGFPMTLDRAMKENPDLKKLYEEDADTKTIIEMAKKIEGNARHVSVHAAGVVISPKPLVEYTPLQYDTKGEKKIITQYDMYSLDPNAGGEMTVGLLKFDFLGIRNLAIIAETLVRIEKIEGKKITIEKIPIDNKKTFEMLTRGETEGTFQLNGDGMTRALMELKPNTIHDINVMVALYRPGPMDNIREYIARKHGTRPITYLHPKMKDFLDTTYGVLVYQDDLLMTALEVAGYSWGDIDKFPKAVGKKIPEEMRKQHISFVKGCEKHGGMSKDKSEELWKLFEPFQGYGFNKAHAASYGHVAYITAYLKANFPAIYMSAVLTAESGDVEKIGVMIKECKRMGIEVLPPSINESFSQFTVVNEKPYKIRFGLTTIKNFGQGISSAITTERKLNGKFKDLADFLDRVKDKNLNKKSLESLIKCGALDEFGERGRLLSNIDNLLEYHRERMRAPNNQDSLFGLMSDTSTLPGLRLLDAPIATQKDKLLWEKELLGLYISGHPLEAYKDKLLTLQINIEKLPDLREGDTTVIAGIVEEVRDVLTKGNERMVFMRLADLSGIIEVAIFPRILNEFRSFIQPETCIAIKGKVSKRKGETSFIAEKIRAL
ncbi:MAG: polymerase III, alpha subunit protein [Parcubacteria group bacterium GW2011_GWD1_44_9]|nr:MAG: polymerase III, alpha subunit protein [Parcubacteria group bacterium GW2011_GWD1_44_9]